MRKFVEYSIGLFLWFVGVGLKNSKKLLKNTVIQRGNRLGGKRRAMGLKEMKRIRRPLGQGVSDPLNAWYLVLVIGC